MTNRTVKILFKDNTYITFEDQGIGLRNIVDDIKQAMPLTLPYILHSDNQNGYDDTLIIPTENIKYIRVIDKSDDVKKEQK